jgi:hypothetical protein
MTTVDTRGTVSPMKRVIAGAATGLVLAVVVPAPVRAASDLTFDGGTSVSLTPGATVTVTLTNDSPTPYDVSLHVVGRDGAGIISVAVPPTVTVAAGAVAAVPLRAQPDASALTGYVVATTGDNGPVARQRFTVGAAVPEPLTDKWRVTSYRLNGGTHDYYLPLKANRSCPAATVGGLVRDGGGATSVTATCTPQGVRLSFPNLDHRVGDYTGTIDLDPADDQKGAVTLTLRRTDNWPLPLAVLIIGIGVALLAARQSGRLNTLSKAEEDLLRVRAGAVTAAERFTAKAGTAGWASYTFEPAFGDRADATEASLRSLRRAFGPLDDKDETFQRALGDTATLRRIAEAWPAFADRLADLAAALPVAATIAAGDRPGGAATPEPALLAPARELLGGERLDFDAILDRVALVDATATVARRWPADAAAVKHLEQRADLIEAAIRDAGPEHRPDLSKVNEAREAISRAHLTMWEATDPAGYRPGDDLTAADGVLDGLSWYLPDENLAAAGAQHRSPARRRDASASDLKQTLDAPLRRLRRVAAARWTGNLLVLLVTVAVTVVSGLALWYDDKPFGTLPQYLTLLLWGFTAQAALTSLAAALDPLLERRNGPLLEGREGSAP